MVATGGKHKTNHTAPSLWILIETYPKLNAALRLSSLVLLILKPAKSGRYDIDIVGWWVTTDSCGQSFGLFQSFNSVRT